MDFIKKNKTGLIFAALLLINGLFLLSLYLSKN
jgi:hypothetical protein